MGIKINNVISFTFAVGSFLAAIGSMMYFSNYTAVTPTVGAMPGLKAFVAAVFGGIGSIPGAVIGGFIIGICESLIKGAGATTFSDAFTFALLIVVLAVKPTGLFSEKPDRESVDDHETREKSASISGPHWRWPLCWWCCWHWIT